MAKNTQIVLLPALEGYPVVIAFNRYVVTKAHPYVVATCGLVSEGGELLSSFSFAVNREMTSEDSNRDAIVHYLSKVTAKKEPSKPSNINRGIRLPQGGITIAHAPVVNAGWSGNFAEIRLENYASSALGYYFKQNEEDKKEVRCEGIALLRSSFQCHYHLLKDIYVSN